MLYHLLYPLKEIFFGFNVFKYITFRAVASSVTAFLISILLGPVVIKTLTRMKIGQSIRKEDTPALYPLHKEKEGTPTMGGVLILLAVVVSTLLWADLTNRFVMLALFSTVWLGGVGFVDDYIKLVKGESRGLAISTKLFGQLVLGLALAAFLFYSPDFPRTLEMPFFKKLVIDLGIFYLFFVILVIVGSSNAVNLTDGLDGLAVGCSSIVALTYGVMSYIAGNVNFSKYLLVTYLPGAGELSVFCAALAGAGLGFLWFNSHPAQIFMGDTGSLALGGAIGVVAVLIKKELLLLLVGGIFVFEALSVILQVASFRLTGKRIFLMAPIHHHFQLKGHPESKLIVRFWIVAVILALMTLATLKLR